MIDVLLADDQELVRTGFRMILESEPGIKVVGEATTGQEALTLSDRLRPAVVLMDIRMPELDGLQATRQLAARNPAPRVVILTTFDLDEYVSVADGRLELTVVWAMVLSRCPPAGEGSRIPARRTAVDSRRQARGVQQGIIFLPWTGHVVP